MKRELEYNNNTDCYPLSRTPSFIGYEEGVVTNQIVDTLYPIKTILLRRRS